MKKRLLLLAFVSLAFQACGKPSDGAAMANTANTVDPVLVASNSLQDMGKCTGPIHPTCVNHVSTGCAFLNIYSDKTSNQLWTSADGSKQYQGTCSYGSDSNSCPVSVTCP